MHNGAQRAGQTAGRRAKRQAALLASQPAPKLVQWSREPVHYYEASTLVLSCSLAMARRDTGSGANSVKFHWSRTAFGGGGGGANGQHSGGAGGGLRQQTLSVGSREPRLSIETLQDYSFLRLSELRPSDSGVYTCAASDQLGQEDRTSAQVMVNGE